MLTLIDRGALRRAIRDPALGPHLRAILHLRLRQTGGTGARYHVASATDDVTQAEAAVGFPLADQGEPCWEAIRHHPGGWREAVFVLSDDGPAEVLLAPPDAHPSLARLLREHAAG